MNKLHFFALNLLCLVGYILLAKLGLSFAFEQENVSPIWPPTGFAIAIILFFGFRVWPSIFIAAFIVNFNTSIAPFAAGTIALGNTLEALVAALFILQFIGKYPVGSIAHTLFFTFIVLFSTSISASIGVLTLWLSANIEFEHVTHLWLTWWLGDAVGGLVITPWLLTLTQQIKFELNKNLVFELMLLVLATCFSALLVFSHWPIAFVNNYSLSFILLPSIVWASARFYQHGATFIVLFYTLVSVYSTLHGQGPFALPDHNDALLVEQTFMASIMITGLTLAASISERDKIKTSLELSYDNLEQLVLDRTKKLSDALHHAAQEAKQQQQFYQSALKLVELNANPTDERYFHDISSLLAEIFQAQVILIGLFDKQQRITTVSIRKEAQLIGNFCCAIADSCCQALISTKQQMHTDNATLNYPNDKLISQLSVNSVFATPILLPNNEVAGVLLLMDTQALKITEQTQTVLAMVASKIGHQLT
jgi:integral membrane sensor domain MASE1